MCQLGLSLRLVRPGRPIMQRTSARAAWFTRNAWAWMDSIRPRGFIGERVTNAVLFCRFFFQAEDGIRDIGVTGVQTCALPICSSSAAPASELAAHGHDAPDAFGSAVVVEPEEARPADLEPVAQGRVERGEGLQVQDRKASCRERV